MKKPKTLQARYLNPTKVLNKKPKILQAPMVNLIAFFTIVTKLLAETMFNLTESCNNKYETFYGIMVNPTGFFYKNPKTLETKG